LIVGSLGALLILALIIYMLIQKGYIKLEKPAALAYSDEEQAFLPG